MSLCFNVTAIHDLGPSSPADSGAGSSPRPPSLPAWSDDDADNEGGDNSESDDGGDDTDGDTDPEASGDDEGESDMPSYAYSSGAGDGDGGRPPSPQYCLYCEANFCCLEVREPPISPEARCCCWTDTSE